MIQLNTSTLRIPHFMTFLVALNGPLVCSRSIPGYFDGPVMATSTTFKFVYVMSPTNAERCMNLCYRTQASMS